jgi:hypothetical protein
VRRVRISHVSEVARAEAEPGAPIAEVEVERADRESR